MGLCVRHVGADADPRGADLYPLPEILCAGADSWKREGIRSPTALIAYSKCAAKANGSGLMRAVYPFPLLISVTTAAMQASKAICWYSGAILRAASK